VCDWGAQGGEQEQRVVPIEARTLQALQQALDAKGHDVMVLAARRGGGGGGGGDGGGGFIDNQQVTEGR